MSKHLKKGIQGLALLPLIAVAGTAFAQEAPSTEDLDQRIKILERKLELQQEDAAEAAKSATNVSASDAGFAITSANKAYDLRLRFLGQLDYRTFFNDDKAKSSTNTAASANGAGDTFTLRRVRPIFSGTLGKSFEFAFVPDFAGGSENTSTVGLVDFWGSLKLDPALYIKAGKYTLPVVLEPGNSRHFNETPFTNYLAPNRDIGIEVGGVFADKILEYRLGVFNGARDNTSDTNNDGNNDKSLAGRFTVKPLANSSGAFKNLAFSVGGSYGHEDSYNSTTGNASTSGISSISRRSLFSYGANVIDGAHSRISPAITLYSGPYSAVAEYIVEKADYKNPTHGPFTADSSAWRTTFGYVVTGEDAVGPSGEVKPRHPFAVGGQGWGAWEVVAFVSGVDNGDEFFDPAKGALSAASNARSATEFGVGANWYLTRNISVRLNYEQTDFDSAYQRNGAPADNEQAVSARFQLLY